jgi:hypothetical protein
LLKVLDNADDEFRANCRKPGFERGRVFVGVDGRALLGQ